MTRIDLYKSQLRAAKSELRIRTRDFNGALRAVIRVRKTIEQLEKKIDNHMAKSK